MGPFSEPCPTTENGENFFGNYGSQIRRGWTCRGGQQQRQETGPRPRSIAKPAAPLRFSGSQWYKLIGSQWSPRFNPLISLMLSAHGYPRVAVWVAFGGPKWLSPLRYHRDVGAAKRRLLGQIRHTLPLTTRSPAPPNYAAPGAYLRRSAAPGLSGGSALAQ